MLKNIPFIPSQVSLYKRACRHTLSYVFLNQQSKEESIQSRETLYKRNVISSANQTKRKNETLKGSRLLLYY